MSVEALWSVAFAAGGPGSNPAGNVGAGVVILETDRLFGGDSSYYYVGDYSVVGGEIVATVSVTHYAGARNSIFGDRDKFSLKLQGKAGERNMLLQGQLDQAPAWIVLQLDRRAELP